MRSLHNPSITYCRFRSRPHTHSHLLPWRAPSRAHAPSRRTIARGAAAASRQGQKNSGVRESWRRAPAVACFVPTPLPTIQARGRQPLQNLRMMMHPHSALLSAIPHRVAAHEDSTAGISWQDYRNTAGDSATVSEWRKMRHAQPNQPSQTLQSRRASQLPTLPLNVRGVAQPLVHLGFMVV